MAAVPDLTAEQLQALLDFQRQGVPPQQPGRATLPEPTDEEQVRNSLRQIQSQPGILRSPSVIQEAAQGGGKLGYALDTLAGKLAPEGVDPHHWLGEKDKGGLFEEWGKAIPQALAMEIVGKGLGAGVPEEVSLSENPAPPDPAVVKGALAAQENLAQKYNQGVLKARGAGLVEAERNMRQTGFPRAAGEPLSSRERAVQAGQEAEFNDLGDMIQHRADVARIAQEHTAQVAPYAKINQIQRRLQDLDEIENRQAEAVGPTGAVLVDQSKKALQTERRRLLEELASQRRQIEIAGALEAANPEETALVQADESPTSAGDVVQAARASWPRHRVSPAPVSPVKSLAPTEEMTVEPGQPRMSLPPEPQPRPGTMAETQERMNEWDRLVERYRQNHPELAQSTGIDRPPQFRQPPRAGAEELSRIDPRTYKTLGGSRHFPDQWPGAREYDIVRNDQPTLPGEESAASARMAPLKNAQGEPIGQASITSEAQLGDRQRGLLSHLYRTIEQRTGLPVLPGNQTVVGRTAIPEGATAEWFNQSPAGRALHEAQLRRPLLQRQFGSFTDVPAIRAGAGVPETTPIDIGRFQETLRSLKDIPEQAIRDRAIRILAEQADQIDPGMGEELLRQIQAETKAPPIKNPSSTNLLKRLLGLGGLDLGKDEGER